VALVTALLRPDLVRRLVVASGVFHHAGWAPGAIYLDEESIAFFLEFHGAVSPDGPNAFLALNAKLDRMHEEEPTLIYWGTSIGLRAILRRCESSITSGPANTASTRGTSTDWSS
jgi:pimeloyl-ACP methyl ester carboxylesterase